MANYKQELHDLLSTVMKENASDLHISVGRHPVIRVDGGLVPLLKKEVITGETSEGLIQALTNSQQYAVFQSQHELDFSYDYDGKARFRVNIFRQKGFSGAALRLVPSRIRTFTELNLPPILEEFCRRPQGFFLVVGPTGHGKTTTLAAMIDYINRTRNDHIITIEDPIEYIFASQTAIVDQREVGLDTTSFSRALRSMFREDVDVAMIGEMRDAETISAAVTAAETGHLIFSTLHTNNAAQTIDRVIDSFEASQQSQIRAQLSSSLIGIISQRLVPRVNGGLVPAVEVMIANPAIRNLIRENKVHEIDLVIETSSDEGMVSLNRALVELVRKGEITVENAASFSMNPSELSLLLKR
ncbi:MAG: type IV pilus twitching motility protein PilT [Candidatus Sungbacteria bacterium]|nr:type IV pilus twitching motility protein PilT [Candidatus Sungbacteria bacterium]